MDLICFRILIWSINLLLEWFIKITASEITLGLAVAFISLLASLLLFPFLYFVCEYFWQKTPGKFLTKTIVIDEYGNKPDVGSLLLRSLVRLVPLKVFHVWEIRVVDGTTVRQILCSKRNRTRRD